MTARGYKKSQTCFMSQLELQIVSSTIHNITNLGPLISLKRTPPSYSKPRKISVSDSTNPPMPPDLKDVHNLKALGGRPPSQQSFAPGIGKLLGDPRTAGALKDGEPEPTTIIDKVERGRGRHGEVGAALSLRSDKDLV